jgi:hypothetical protein
MAIVSVVNEGSSSYLTITFYDQNGIAAAPNSATYEVHDADTETVMLAETALPAGASVEVEMTPAVNTIVNDEKTVETRIVTIQALYGSEAINEEYRYKLKNLRFV